jgi:hypothetical protein
MPVCQKALIAAGATFAEDAHSRIDDSSPYDGDAKPDWSRDFSTCR